MSPQLRRLFAASLVVFASALLGFGGSAQATDKSVVLEITAVDISQQVDQSDGQIHDFLSLAGSVTNSGTTALPEDLHIISGRPIATRSELDSLIAKRTASGLTPANSKPVLITQLASGETAAWSFTVRADNVWGTNASGVFPVGVSTPDGLVTDVVAIPWFGNTQQLSPTRVTAAVVLTSEKNVSDQPDAASIISSEASRLSSLTSGSLDDQSFIVDNYALDLLTQSDSEQARETSVRISLLKTTPSIYANSNLARLNAGNQQPAIKRALALTPNAGTVLYLPDSAQPSLDSFGARFDSLVVPVVSNTFVAGDKSATVDARARTKNQRALVVDQSLSDCVTLQSAFAVQWCISSQLGMITAESPNVSRHVLLKTPANWAPGPETLSAVARALQTTQSYTNESLASLLGSTPVTDIATRFEPALPFDSSVRKVERDVLRAQTSVENVFGETQVSKSLASTAVQMYSQTWKQSSSAKHFGRAHVKQAHELLNQLRLEGSRHITIPGTKADLPITIFNSSAFAAHVQVIVSGTGANRITAKPSELIAVDPGSRVTVQIPITLNSAGDVQAVAYLADSTGDTFGDSLPIQIASTAYQQFARSLVWVALTALVLLVGNNVWRRTRAAQEDQNA